MQAYSDIRVLISAASRFNNEYRLWPVYNPPLKGDVRYGDRNPNSAIYRILSATEGEGNEMHRANPVRINFIQLAAGETSQLRFNNVGEIIDPWGSPYQIVFDSNYDSICSMDDSIYGPIVGEGVVIWSKGADLVSGTEDDLKSWIN